MEEGVTDGQVETIPHSNWYVKHAFNIPSHDFSSSKYFTNGDTAADKRNALLYHQNMDTPEKEERVLLGLKTINGTIKTLDYDKCKSTLFL
jgi:hypothetical protein